MRTPTTTAIAAALLLTGATAQERFATIGFVRDAAGAAVAGAAVTLAHVPRGGEGEPAADVVAATTDERGRYRVTLLPCAPYRVWAIGPAQEDGSRPASAVTWTHAAELAELELRDSVWPIAVQLAGVEAWSDDGPLAVRWCVDSVLVDPTPVAVDAEGAVVAPPLPSTRTTGELLDAAGNLITTFHFDPRARTRRARIDPPQRIAMRATTADGTPVPGVEIRLRVRAAWTQGDPLAPSAADRRLWRRLGTTDAEGRLVGRIAQRQHPLEVKDWQQLMFFAGKQGFATAISGFDEEPYADGETIAREGLQELPFRMQPSQPLQGRITHGERPCTDVELRLVARHLVRRKGSNSSTVHQVVWRGRADDEGRYRIEALPPTIDGGTLLLLPAANALPNLPADARRSMPPQPFAFHRLEWGEQRAVDLDLGATCTVHMQVLTASGGPASGARVMPLSLVNELECDWTTPLARTDSAGRLTLQLQPGKWFLFVRDELSMASRELDLKADVEHTLQLAPMPALRGVVIDGDDVPIAGAQFSWSNMSFTGDLGHDPLHAIARHLNGTWINSVRTDADGRFVIAMIDAPGIRFRGSFRDGRRQSPGFWLRPADEPETIVIE